MKDPHIRISEISQVLRSIISRPHKLPRDSKNPRHHYIVGGSGRGGRLAGPEKLCCGDRVAALRGVAAQDVNKRGRCTSHRLDEAVTTMLSITMQPIMFVLVPMIRQYISEGVASHEMGCWHRVR